MNQIILKAIIGKKGYVWDSDALAYINIHADLQALSTTRKDAINYLITKLKTNGSGSNIWNKIKLLDLFEGSTATSQLYDAKNPSVATHRPTWVGAGITHDTNGVHSNGAANTYVNLNFKPNDFGLTVDNIGIGVYRQKLTVDTGVYMGCTYDDGIYNSATMFMLIGNTYFPINSHTDNPYTSGVNNGGFHFTTRRDTSNEYYYNNALEIPSATASSIAGARNVYLFGRNNNGSLGFVQAGDSQLVVLTEKLTKIEATYLSTIIEIYLWMEGRNAFGNAMPMEIPEDLLVWSTLTPAPLDNIIVPAEDLDFDDDVADYLAAVAAKSVSLTDTEKSAWNVLVKSAKNNGYYRNWLAVYPKLGSSLAAFYINAIDPRSISEGTFTGTPTVDGNGVEYNGTSQVLNTHFNAAGMGMDDLSGAAMFYYALKDTITESVMGTKAFDGTANGGLFITPKYNKKYIISAGCSQVTNQFTALDFTKCLHYVDIEAGLTGIMHYYVNKTKVYTAVGTFKGIDGGEVREGAVAGAGTKPNLVYYYSNMKFAFSGLMLPVTYAVYLKMRHDILVFLKTLGRIA
jgi:hypothetical protein